MANYESSIARNRRQAAVLLVVLFVLVAVAVAAVGVYMGVGSTSLVMIAVIISVVSVWTSYWKSDTIVLKITRAKVINRDAAPQLYNIVEEVCIAAGLPIPTIAIVDDVAPNAFATGRSPDKAVVAFTTGLLEKMDRSELQGVAAHELAHVANRDTLVMTIAATTAGLIALLADLAWRVALFGGGRRNQKSHPAVALIAIITIVLAPLAAALLRSALSRSRESLADATAVAYTRNPAGLRRALEKLAADSTVVRARSTATAHMWIESPLAPGKVSKMFSTHPPIEERIAALAELEGRV